MMCFNKSCLGVDIELCWVAQVAHYQYLAPDVQCVFFITSFTIVGTETAALS